MNERIHTIIMNGPTTKPLFRYSPTGILFMRGFYKGENLTQDYKDANKRDHIEDLLLGMLDGDITYKERYQIKEVIKDLRNGRY